MVQILKKPQISLSKFTGFVTSDTVIVVAGALLVTPILLGVLSSFVIGRIPVVRENVMLTLAVSSLILFIIAAIMKGKIRLLFLGASAGALINAIQQTTFAQNVLGRIGGGN